MSPERGWATDLIRHPALLEWCNRERRSLVVLGPNDELYEFTNSVTVEFQEANGSVYTQKEKWADLAYGV